MWTCIPTPAPPPTPGRHLSLYRHLQLESRVALPPHSHHTPTTLPPHSHHTHISNVYRVRRDTCFSATPLVSTTIAERWFTLPNAIGLAPIPLTCALVFAGLTGFFTRPTETLYRYAWVPFTGAVIIGVMAAIGLFYSLYPYVVIDELTIWEAASATSSRQFVLVGVVITIPAIIGYSIYVYRIFAVKATDLDYG